MLPGIQLNDFVTFCPVTSCVAELENSTYSRICCPSSANHAGLYFGNIFFSNLSCVWDHRSLRNTNDRNMCTPMCSLATLPKKAMWVLGILNLFSWYILGIWNQHEFIFVISNVLIGQFLATNQNLYKLSINRVLVTNQDGQRLFSPGQ